jgi:hypothetical protein
MLIKENQRTEAVDSTTSVRLRIQEIYSLHSSLHSKAPENVMDAIRDLRLKEGWLDEFEWTEQKSVVQFAREIRVNKLKEMLVYTDFSTDHICRQLHYSSVEEMEGDLTDQTGLNLVFYQNLKKQRARLVQKSGLNKIQQH